MHFHSRRNWQPGSYQFLLLFGKFTVDVLGTLSLILYKIPYHRLLLVHLFIYHLIARPTMGNYYILKFRKWFKYGLGAYALSGRMGLTCETCITVITISVITVFS